MNIQPKESRLLKKIATLHTSVVPLPRRSFPFRLLATSSLATRSPWRQPLCTFTTVECSDRQRCRWSRPVPAASWATRGIELRLTARANGISLIRTFSVANCACLVLCIHTVPRCSSFMGIVTRGVLVFDDTYPWLSFYPRCLFVINSINARSKFSKELRY